MTPGQAACVAWNEHYAEEHGITARNEWAASDLRGRAAWEAAAQAAREHRGELPPHMPPEEAYSPEETAYEAFTVRRGTSRIAWEALSAEERADWRAVVKALAKRNAPRRTPKPDGQ